MTTLTAASDDVSDVSFDRLYYVIVQCFAIIFFGYIAGRAGLVTSVQSNGIGTFVSKFCLPALLFKSMCELNFSQVNWMFLMGILIAKASLFTIVGLATLLIKRPLNLGYAGIFGIFATQSNDFALGYPIVQALYGTTHPEFLKALYLIAPISLVFLNPVGFILMEIHKHHSVQDESRCQGIRRAILHVVKGVILNPIVFMTIIGVAGNFIFSGSVPDIINGILTVLGNAFNASALFYLGLNMVGKIKSQLGICLVVPVLLITAKNLLLPLITWEVVEWLETGNDTKAYTMYAFLYGTFPSAPSVFLYASNYGIAEDVIATGLVLGTFLSAPLMFVSAKMMTLTVASRADYKQLLTNTSFNISFISISCCLWVIAIFVLNGKWRRIPHQFSIALMLSHMLACIGMIVFYYLGDTKGWQHFCIVIILLIGVFATRCWTAAIAVALCLLHVRSLCYVLRKKIWFYFFGFGIPVFATGVLFLLGPHEISGEADPSFHYGYVQTSFSLMIISFSIIITITSLVWWQRTERQVAHHVEEGQYCKQETISSCIDGEDPVLGYDQAANIDDPRMNIQESLDSPPTPYMTDEHCQLYSEKNLMKSTSIEDLIPYPTSDGRSSPSDIMQNINERTCLLGECSPEQRHECMKRLRTYTANDPVNNDSPQEMDVKSTKQLNKEEYQTVHHLILLLLFLLSMFIGMFLCIWRIFRNQPTGIYVEIEFLDCVFNYGQGLIVLMVFGFDTRLVLSPIVRRLRRYFFGNEMVQLPKLSDLDSETKQTCQQFTDYHKENCAREIVRDRRFQYRTFKNVFTGTAMCDWLIRAGLATDRDTSVAYGRRLLLGRVITHTSGEQNFHDAPYFYQFLDTFEYMAC
ncbi:hypothetical protein BsWGS_00803 [Bradybaena similaris]